MKNDALFVFLIDEFYQKKGQIFVLNVSQAKNAHKIKFSQRMQSRTNKECKFSSIESIVLMRLKQSKHFLQTW